MRADERTIAGLTLSEYRRNVADGGCVGCGSFYQVRRFRGEKFCEWCGNQARADAYEERRMERAACGGR